MLCVRCLWLLILSGVLFQLSRVPAYGTLAISEQVFLKGLICLEFYFSISLILFIFNNLIVS